METIFTKAYEGSYYTITGCGGNLQEWKDGYKQILSEQGIGELSDSAWIEFTGRDMNIQYGLTDGNAYPEDLHFLAFSLDGLNCGKLAMLRLKMQDKWFDDIVDNNARRQEALNNN